MAISLKLADSTVPMYPAPDYAPLDYAGLDVDSAPVRTTVRITRDIVFGACRYAFYMARTVPVVLRLLALSVIGMAYILIGLGRLLQWFVTGGPRVGLRVARIAAKPVTAPVAAYQRRRIPFAEIA